MAIEGVPLLQLDGLHIELQVARASRVVVSRVDLSISAGEAVGLVGESGSGKSLTARAVMRLLPPKSQVNGRVLIDGVDIHALSNAELRRLRRSTVAMIHQDPRSALNPVRTIGDFLFEGLLDRPADEREQLATQALAEVGIDDGARRFRQYPHQLSGGLLQRVMIAAALLPGPRLVLADEPTTALDVTSQSEVMAVLHDLQETRGVGLLFITHDLDLAAAVTDRLAVMYAGVIVETGPTATMHQSARHPYTVALMASRPSTTSRAELKTIPGRPVSAFEAGPGCVFVQRCPFATDLCRSERPVPRPVDGHDVACHRAEELTGRILQGLEAGA